MNRQTKRRLFRNLSDKEVDRILDYFARETHISNKQVVMKFLSLTIEALRLEFDSNEEEIDRYVIRVNDLVDSVDLGYLSFEDLLDEISLKPMDIAKIPDDVKEQKLKVLAG